MAADTTTVRPATTVAADTTAVAVSRLSPLIIAAIHAAAGAGTVASVVVGAKKLSAENDTIEHGCGGRAPFFPLKGSLVILSFGSSLPSHVHIVALTQSDE